jgi:hypothetical protein
MMHCGITLAVLKRCLIFSLLTGDLFFPPTLIDDFERALQQNKYRVSNPNSSRRRLLLLFGLAILGCLLVCASEHDKSNKTEFMTVLWFLKRIQGTASYEGDRTWGQSDSAVCARA